MILSYVQIFLVSNFDKLDEASEDRVSLINPVRKLRSRVATVEREVVSSHESTTPPVSIVKPL